MVWIPWRSTVDSILGCYPKNRGTLPQNGWLVYNGNPNFLMDDLVGKPTILGVAPIC